MKLLKNIFVLLCIVSIVSCGKDDDSTPSYDLSNENIAGDYILTSYEHSIETNSTTVGTTSPISSIEAEGSTLEVEGTFNSDGTFELSGEFLLTTKNSTTGLSDTSENSFIDIEDATGTYVLNNDESKITLNFTSSLDEDLIVDLSGEYDVKTFSTSELIISMEDINSESATVLDITTTTEITTIIDISFDR